MTLTADQHALAAAWIQASLKPPALFPQLPDNSALLDVRLVEWGMSESNTEHSNDIRRHKLSRWSQLLGSGSTCELFIGLPWTKEEFVHEAIHIEHPLYTSSCASASHSLRAVFNILVNGPTATVKKRSDFIHQLRKWKKDLQHTDEAIKAGMNP